MSAQADELASTEQPDESSSNAAVIEPNGVNGPASAIAVADESAVASRSDLRRMRRAARDENGKRPRAPKAERQASRNRGDEAVTALPSGDEETADTTDHASADVNEAVMALAGTGKRGTRTVRRASKKQRAASEAVKGAADNPALGALNRHLNTMTQQLTNAHRVIGRVAAERDALRQQLADLQGIPVEQIVVSTIGASTEPAAQPAKSAQPASAAQPSKLARFNYFGGEDFAVMRKRRQMLLLAVIALVIVLGFAARMGLWALPSNLSRDSLGSLPFVGDFMSIFLAGWLFFRVIRVSSKGVKWVFPSEDQRRRKR